MSGQKPIIIKKINKHHGGHHGGSWKVAYADFVTAMMAFFLLLWLLSMVSDEKRARLSEYFKYFSLYSQSGESMMSETSGSLFNDPGQAEEKVFTEMQGEKANEIDQIEENLHKAIVDNLGDMEDQVLIERIGDGIRVHLVDKDGSLMFELGSSKMTAKAKEIISVIANNIKHLINKVSIEGHTDSLPFASRSYSNWELSTERASSARRELEASGLDPKRIMRVSGYADTDPLIKENPDDPRNRRISIILQFPKKKKKAAVNVSRETPLTKMSEELLTTIDTNPVATSNTKEDTPDNVIIDIKQSDEEATSEADKKWGQSINQEKWNPVMEDNLRNKIIDDILKKESSFINKKDSATPSANKSASGAIQSSDSTPANDGEGDTSNDPAAADWSPVFQNESWSPVFNQD